MGSERSLKELSALGSGESSAQAPAPPTAAPESIVAAPASNDGTLLTNSVGMDLKLIPAGTFKMGDNSFFLPNMQPTHKVTLTKDFFIGVYEVTQEQYERVMGNNPSFRKDPQKPVDKVSWDDAVEFCRKLSELPEEKAAGYVYRLPTDAEWEYACRAGTKTVYSFGDDESQLGDFEWYYENSDGGTHPVGQKTPNGLGLYDMHGNVWEWCENRFYYYAKDSVRDPLGPSSGSNRVSRGGSYLTLASHCRSAVRFQLKPTESFSTLGFRVALSPVM